MEPETFLGGAVTLHHGDSREVLKSIPDNSVDSVCCDPPYALVSIVKRFGGPNAAPSRDGDVYARSSAGFMNQAWDTGETAFAVEFWAEVFRVLKPGGHVIAFSGTRTYHRLACAIEDAGFEIRDMVSWLYGSGFPKSHDVSKAIDKAAGAEREVVGTGKGRTGAAAQPNGGSNFSDDNYQWPGEFNVTAPATPEAAQWQGWGTALKPACEPCVLARKPLIGTVAANVLAHGTGVLNIDGCRVGDEEIETRLASRKGAGGQAFGVGGSGTSVKSGASHTGRWPANVVHDGSEEVVAGFPETTSGTFSRSETARSEAGKNGIYGRFNGTADGKGWESNSGSAARFFYSAKADAMDRVGSGHPTVKPVDLMQWMVRLITPPGGVTLDPFAGSGTTGEAAFREGFKAILIEREAAYCEDIRRRMELAAAGDKTKRRAIAKAKAKDEPLGGLFA